MHKLPACFVAVALTALPVQSEAASRWVDLQGMILPGGTYLLSEGPYFWSAGYFEESDPAQTVSFTFVNDVNAAQAYATVGVVQVADTFEGGVDYGWGGGDAARCDAYLICLWDVLYVDLAPGEEAVLTFSWGEPLLNHGVIAIELRVGYLSSVPVPAPFVLFAAALATLAAFSPARRSHSAV